MNLEDARALHEQGLMTQAEVDAVAAGLDPRELHEPEPEREPSTDHVPAPSGTDPAWFATGEHPLHPEVAGEPAPS